MIKGLLSGICPTFNRPELLGRAIKAFERQTYKNKFLVIIDDLGQYNNQRGDCWELISFPRRVLSLSEKNNIAAALAPRNVWGYFKYDDDDFMSPWALEALADALTRGPFVQPRRAIDYFGRWVVVETFKKGRPNFCPICYHGQWAYRRELFAEIGGYRPEGKLDDDADIEKRIREMGISSTDVNWKRFKPFYWYNRLLLNRISEKGGARKSYWNMEIDVPFIGKVPVWKDNSDWERKTPTKIISRPW